MNATRRTEASALYSGEEALTGFRAVIFHAFSGGLGFAGVEDDVGYLSPAKGPLPELKDDGGRMPRIPNKKH